jgi:hypothetical protein
MPVYDAAAVDGYGDHTGRFVTCRSPYYGRGPIEGQKVRPRKQGKDVRKGLRILRAERKHERNIASLSAEMAFRRKVESGQLRRGADGVWEEVHHCGQQAQRRALSKREKRKLRKAKQRAKKRDAA